MFTEANIAFLVVPLTSIIDVPHGNFTVCLEFIFQTDITL